MKKNGILEKLKKHPSTILVFAVFLILVPIVKALIGGALIAPDLLILFGGLLSLIRHKTVWLLAILLFSAAAVVSGWHFSSPSDVGDLVNLTLSLTAISAILYYFRYPYIERRQQWFGLAARRYNLNTDVYLKGKSFKTADLSMVGMSIFKSQDDHFDVDEELSVDIPAVGLSEIKAQVVNVSAKKIHFKFVFADSAYKKILQKWLDSQG